MIDPSAPCGPERRMAHVTRLDDQSPARPRPILVVTGMSGAGKTSALKALEDAGYDAVDHVPISLLPRLVGGEDEEAAARPPLAVGVDVRTRDFSVERFASVVDDLAEDGDRHVRLLFLECDDDELRRRYTATRHRHPLAHDRPILDGIALERQMIAHLKRHADIVIDTTRITPGDLKHLLDGHFGLDVTRRLSVFVTSFAFRLGLPREADLVFDVRFLKNPFYQADLRALSGQDRPVAAHIEEDPGLEPFLTSLRHMLAPLLPRYTDEGKSYLTIAIGCSGGRHRSVYVAERLGAWLAEQSLAVRVNHRDLAISERSSAPSERE